LHLLFGRFKKVKSVLKTKNKKILPPCGTALSPAAVPLNGRVMAPR
jgi:hypothetical protein